MRLRHGIGLAVFCLLAGSRWLLDAVWLWPIPSLLTQSFHLAFMGLVAVVLSLGRGQPRIGMPASLQLAAASLPLVAPPALLALTGTAIRPETSVALYALAPICIVGIVAFTNESVQLLMMPALCGLAGALLILPWRLPANAAEAISFAAVLLGALLAAMASVWTHRLLRSRHLSDGLIAITLGNAAVFGLIGFARGERMPTLTDLPPSFLRFLLLDMPQLLLLLYLLRAVAPERFASRFFFVPLVTILEGLVFLHGPLDLRTAVGTLLLLFGAGTLVLARSDPTSRLNLS